MSLRIIITGATGYIGGTLLRHLQAAGQRCGVLVPPTCAARFPANVDVRQGNLQDAIFLAEACAGADAIVHLAGVKGSGPCATDIGRAMEANVRYTQAILAATPPAALLILASSYWVYGHRLTPPFSERDIIAPAEPYGWTKALAEALVRESGKPHVIVRLANVFGYGCGQRYDDVVSLFVGKAMRGETIHLRQGGTNRIDLVWVDDVCAVISRFLAERHSTLTLNIGSGVPTSIAGLAEVINDVVASLGGSRAVVSRDAAPLAPVQVVDRWLDIGELQKRTQYRLCPLRAAVEATARAMQQQGGRRL